MASAFHAAWVHSSGVIFAVGENGAAARFDGKKWTALKTGTTATLKTVWGSSPTDVFAAGGSMEGHGFGHKEKLGGGLGQLSRRSVRRGGRGHHPPPLQPLNPQWICAGGRGDPPLLKGLRSPPPGSCGSIRATARPASARCRRSRTPCRFGQSPASGGSGCPGHRRTVRIARLP